jgi:hypothetical protein
VVYTFPVELKHAEEGPVIEGTGSAFTVTLLIVGEEAVQLFELV